MHDPTPRQLDVLRYVRYHRQRYLVSPTLREVGTVLGITPVTTLGLVRALVAKGYLTTESHQARSARLTELGETFLKGDSYAPPKARNATSQTPHRRKRRADRAS